MNSAIEILIWDHNLLGKMDSLIIFICNLEKEKFAFMSNAIATKFDRRVKTR